MNNEIATLIDEKGNALIVASELAYSTQTQNSLDEASPPVKKMIHLTSDLLKGAISLPNKTIEVIFKPEIQNGLNDSIYRLMTTKNGEVLADAIDGSTGQIVGKGRVVETGKTKQLVSGAFQLASIVVAQSHLSDINASLTKINLSLEKILEKFESVARSEIRGAVAYLHDFVEFMENQKSPEDIPSEKKMKLEDICYDFKKWRDYVFSEMTSVISKIKAQKDIDTFGTGDTYMALKQHIGDAKTLTDRYKLLLDLASKFNFLAAYLDPLKKQFSRVDPKTNEWNSLINQLEKSGKAKIDELLKSALFNQDETLSLRHQDLTSELEKQNTLAIINHRNYFDENKVLTSQVERILSNQGEMRLSISFDAAGAAEKMAILPV